MVKETIVSDVLRSQSLCPQYVTNVEGREMRASLGTKHGSFLSMELVYTWASWLDQDMESERKVGFSGPLRDLGFFFFFFLVLWHLLKALLHLLRLVLFQSELEGDHV